MSVRTQFPALWRRIGDVRQSALIASVLTTLSYVVGVGFGWVNPATLNLLEVFAVLTSYACTYLCVKQRRINYPIGAVSTAAYSVLFLQSGLIASALLNIYLTPALIYGWFRWRKDTSTRPVTTIELKWLPAYVIATALAYGGAWLLSQRLGGTMAWTDSVILIGTVLAQFLLDNKKLENWFVWAIVNIFAIYTYAAAGLPLAAFQYVFFLGNTVLGYLMWKRSKDHENRLRSTNGATAHQGALAVSPIRE